MLRKLLYNRIAQDTYWCINHPKTLNAKPCLFTPSPLARCPVKARPNPAFKEKRELAISGAENGCPNACRGAFISLVHTSSQRHSIKPDILPTSLNEPLWAQRQRLVTQHILALLQRPALQRALAPPIQLPQLAVVTLYKTHVVQVDVIRGLRRGRVALAGGGVVCLRQTLRCLEELGARDGIEWDGLFEEFVKGGAGFWKELGNCQLASLRPIVVKTI